MNENENDSNEKDGIQIGNYILKKQINRRRKLRKSL